MSDRPDRRAPERRKQVADRRRQALLDRREWLNQLAGDWDRGMLPGNVQVGKDCYLESTGTFGSFKSARTPGLVLGDRVAVYGWTKFTCGGDAFIEVGDDSVLAGAHFMCWAQISVGRRVVMSYHVLLADSDMHPVEPDLRRRETVALAYYDDSEKRQPVVPRPITIGDDVWIGMAALILKGVSIGAGARVEPGSVVVNDVPAGATVAGNPARLVEAEPERP
jgi:acetyltransferase-like isoleucine patch superfamily enzyme